MTSFRTRAATRVVSTLGVKRRLQELTDSHADPAQFDRLLKKTRKYDRRDPPPRMRTRMRHEQVDVDGHVLHFLSDEGRRNGRVILYLHGGGYMLGPFAPEWKMASSIAASTSSDLAVFLYPRTPDDQAERTVNITLQAYRAVLDRFSGHEVVLVGTSAGGGLSIVLMVEAALRGMLTPSRAVLVSPAVDMALQENLDAAEAGDVLLSADYVRFAGRLYAGALATVHPWISPTNGNLEGLPPLQVFAGSREILSPSIETFVGQVRAEGSSVELILGEGQQHTWPTMPTPEGHQARGAISAFIVGENT